MGLPGLVDTELVDVHHTVGIAVSMSRRGNCWDNAVVESFMATLKWELVADANCPPDATRPVRCLSISSFGTIGSVGIRVSGIGHRSSTPCYSPRHSRQRKLYVHQNREDH